MAINFYLVKIYYFIPMIPSPCSGSTSAGTSYINCFPKNKIFHHLSIKSYLELQIIGKLLLFQQQVEVSSTCSLVELHNSRCFLNSKRLGNTAQFPCLKPTHILKQTFKGIKSGKNYFLFQFMRLNIGGVQRSTILFV